MQTKINLLPAECRRKEMTPIAVLLPILVAVTLVLASGAFWAWLHFGELAQVQTHHDELVTIVASKQSSLRYASDLRAESSEYKQRSDTIQEIAKSRVPWTRKLDELCNVVADDHGGERYLVWLETFQVKVPASRGGKKATVQGEEVSIKGLCFSDEAPLQRFNNFHEALKQSPFYGREFMAINNPAGKAIDAGGSRDKKLRPAKAWTMDLELNMVPRGGEDKKPGRPGISAEVNKK